MNYDATRFSTRIDCLSWEQLGKIGKSRLLALSYGALIALTVYIHLGTAINRVGGRLHDWTESVFGVGFAIPRMPVGFEQWTMLVSLVLMAAAATVYKYSCPPIVQEYSEPQWRFELKRSVIEYRGANWFARKRRLWCLGLYAFSGWAVLILACRIARALWIGFPF